MKLILNLILILILIFINGFFAASEIAIISLDKDKLHLLALKNNKKAILLEKILKEPAKFLSTIQVAITLAGFFSSASAATSLAVYIEKYLEPVFFSYSQEISIILVTIILSYVTLVLGELFPKRIALERSESIGLASAVPITMVSKALYPFIKILSVSTNFVSTLFGIETYNMEKRISEEEIIETLKVGQETGLINETEYNMLTNIFHFDDICIYQLMTPRSDMIALDIDTNIDEVFKFINEYSYTRFPIYENDLDNIVGILNVKTLLKKLTIYPKEMINIREILFPAIFVHEKKKADVLFKEIQDSKNPMAIVKNEYGFVVGLITIEDLVEEVMGEIMDEYDTEGKEVEVLEDGSLLVKGSYPIYKFEKLADVKFKSKEYQTLAGYIFYISHKAPKINDRFKIESSNVTLEINSIKKSRVTKIRVIFENE